MSNLAAEKVFLAGVVKHPLKLFDFLEYLSEDDFKHAATRITFEALRSLITTKEAEKITKSKLVAEAKALGHQNYLSVTKDGAWVDELLVEDVAPHEIQAHFLEVKRQSLKESYTDAFGTLKDYLSTTDDSLSVMIGKVENEIISKVNLIDKGEHAVVDVRDGFKEFITSLADDPGHIGLDLGYPIWQERIGHIRNGGVTFVVGSTGCLAGDSKIYDARLGIYRNLTDVVRKKTGAVLSLNKNKLCSRRIKDAFYSGRKQTYKLMTRTGIEIVATSNHPFLTNDGWRELSSLKIGDYVAVARKILEPTHPINSFSYEEMYLLGALFGDGGLTGTTIVFSNENNMIVKKMMLISQQLSFDMHQIPSKKHHYSISVEARPLLEEIDIWHYLSKDKTISDLIYSTDNRRLASFFAGIWDTDGYIDIKKTNKGLTYCVGITLASQRAVYQLQQLLRRFGVLSSVRYKLAKCNGKEFDSWRLTILDRLSVKAFFDTIVPYMVHNEKVDRSIQIRKIFDNTIHNSNTDVFSSSIIFDIVRNHCIQRKLSSKKYNHCFPDKYSGRNITRSRILAIGRELDCQKLIDIANSDIFYDKIISIHKDERQDVYDLEISVNHNFIANDFIVHNSGKSLFGTKAAVIAARKRLPVLILDSELNKNEQWIRIAAMLTKTPSQYIETGFWRMTEDELRRHGVKDQNKIDEIVAYGLRIKDPRLWEAIEQMPLFYQSISGLSVSDVIPHMRRWVLTHVKPDRETRVPQCLIVYDYIKLAMTNEIKSGVLAEWQQHGLHVAAIHDFAKQYNIPIIAFGQTNNEIDDGIKCVAGGKRISENVTSVSYFKRKTDNERAGDSVGTHMIKIFKSRFGMGLWGSHINYDADLSCGDFKELGIGSVKVPDHEDDDHED